MSKLAIMTDTRLDVMRRYVEDYTNGHDIAAARQILHPDYRFTMVGATLDLETYLTMVEDAFARFADLRLVVDEFVIGPRRLAMGFYETATSPKTGLGGWWRGVALYRFHDDGRLAEVRVEQDFWSRRLQFAGELEATPPVTPPDVWDAAAAPGNPDIDLAAVLAASDPAGWHFDDGSPLVVDVERIEILDGFTAGDRFAAALLLHGPYRTGRGSDLGIADGAPVTISVTGTGTLADGVVTEARFVSDRWGLARRARNEG